ncbi:hypothetical protein B0H17DRAFT_1216145 [Mycena rosella]|uniref:SAM domain-containing protein n=1 Tax=Mycena rosella TaxID=1033263 RepID=A0AAD7C9Y1_MYCRO|nr:hypothetical protein B0H17DRAFT_1216145 [Mycena rosella]
MGTRKNAQKKKKKETGQRKTKKNAVGTPDTTPPPRPKPIPRVKLTVPQPERDELQTSAASSNKEDEAAAVLMAMGSKIHRDQSGFETAMDHVFRSAVPGMEDMDFTADVREPSKGDRSEGSYSDSTSEQSSDSEDSDTVLDIPVSSPAQQAHGRKSSKFTIPFEVPFNGAVRDLEGITSRTPFDEFLDELAQAMSTRKSLLSGIAYIPSYKPKSPKPIPKLLDSKQAWSRLITDVENYINTSKAKRRGNGDVKPFFIQIGKKGDKDPEPAIKETPEHQLYRQLEQKYQCAEHHKACIVQSDGNHYHLTAADLAKWAHMANMHTATLSTVPEELNISDAGPRQHKAKKALARTAGTPSDEPAWLSGLQQVMGMAVGGMMMPGLMRNNLPPVLAPQTPRAARTQPTPGSSGMADHQPSSGTKRAAAVHAPDIQRWLSGLDLDAVRGRHNTYYVQYTQSFENSGILDLTDIEDLSADEIVRISSAPIGIAKRIVKYAKEDLAKLLNEANKRVRN